MRQKEGKMETVNIFGKYKVYIGKGLLQNLQEVVDLKNFSKVVVITDEKIPAKFLSGFEKIIISPGEAFKNIETVQVILKEILRLGCDR
jgi:3-dehydroquinate synthetase